MVEVVLEVVDEDLPVVLENQEDDCQEKKTDEKDDQIDHENHVHNSFTSNQRNQQTRIRILSQ